MFIMFQRRGAALSLSPVVHLMNLGVFLKVAIVDKAFLTDRAAEWLLACVRPHVNDEGALLGEGLVAEGAAERLLALVHRCDVAVDVALVPEAHAAVGAAERLLARVDPHVRLQVALLAEAALARRADERLLVLVDDHVLAVRRPVPEGLVAHGALERSLPAMSQHVFLQLHVARKRLAADRAPSLLRFPLAPVLYIPTSVVAQTAFI